MGKRPLVVCTVLLCKMAVMDAEDLTVGQLARLVAAHADTDVRTFERYCQGLPLRTSTRQRIERALRELNVGRLTPIERVLQKDSVCTG